MNSESRIQGSKILIFAGVLLAVVAGAGMNTWAADVDPPVQALRIPGGAPGRFSLEVRLGDRSFTLMLIRHSLRASNAQVLVYRGGELTQIPVPAPRTYRGSISGVPGSEIVAHLDDTGIHAIIISNEIGQWSIDPSKGDGLESPHGLHVVRAGPVVHSEPFTCGTDSVAPARADGDVAMRGQPEGPACQTLAQVAFDADFPYYQMNGSSEAAVIAAIDAAMNQIDFHYARDVLISYAITTYIVRTEPFYDPPTSGGDLLDQFRDEWVTNHTGIVRDLTHLKTNADNIQFGGLAWVVGSCTAWNYGWSLYNTPNAMGHEMGHNWGAGHCHDLTPCNNMCGGCLYVAPNTRDIFEASRDSGACLDDVGPHATPLPPYAYPEAMAIRKSDYDGIGSAAFDVLGNDEDGNCDLLSIDAFDAVSTAGATVTLTAGTGPGGRDELVYALPTQIFIGEDTFQYTVGDGTGEQTAGTVSFDVRPEKLRGYWKLDAAGGSVAEDATFGATHGTIFGGATWAFGRYNGSLRFDGVNDYVEVPALNLYTDRITFTTWLRRNGEQAAWSGIVYSNDADTNAGLSFGPGNELRYTWNGEAGTYNWSTGLIVPDGEWVFVAMVVAPNVATVFMDAGVMQSAEHVYAHGVEEFNGLLDIGRDRNSASRRFDGWLDEVRVYDYALTANEIDDVRAHGARATTPQPADGGKLIASDGIIEWTAGPVTDSHDVYFGSDYVAVRDATTESGEYRGSLTKSWFDPPGVAQSGITYFWRIDERIGASEIPGHVWQYTLADFGHWSLDEASGTTASNTMGGQDGIYVNGPLLDQPSASPILGTAVSFDGINDYVSVPALDLNSDRVTITAWMKRDGSQVPFTGLVFSRDGDTVAGLNLGNQHELRYHWNGGNWDWDSGVIVPDGEWVFVALVVEPDQATIFMGDQGVLASAVDSSSHAIEEFDGVTYFGRDRTDRQFRGLLDDVRIYKAVLTTVQIESLYESGLGLGIPTVSQWGLIAVTFLLLSAGTIVFRRRHCDSAVSR